MKITENHIDEAASFFHPHKAYCKSANKHIQNPFAGKMAKLASFLKQPSKN